METEIAEATMGPDMVADSRVIKVITGTITQRQTTSGSNGDLVDTTDQAIW